MPGRSQRIRGRILTLFLPGVAVLRVINSIIFYILGVLIGVGAEPTLFIALKSFLNRLLGMLALLAMPALVVGIILLVIGYKKKRKAKEGKK